MYSSPKLKKLTPEEATLRLTGRASFEDPGAKDLLELLYPESQRDPRGQAVPLAGFDVITVAFEVITEAIVEGEVFDMVSSLDSAYAQNGSWLMNLTGKSWIAIFFLASRDPERNVAVVDGLIVGLLVLAITPLLSLYTVDIQRIYPGHFIWGVPWSGWCLRRSSHICGREGALETRRKFLKNACCDRSCAASRHPVWRSKD